jgi:hypothetical protein
MFSQNSDPFEFFQEAFGRGFGGIDSNPFAAAIGDPTQHRRGNLNTHSSFVHRYQDNQSSQSDAQLGKLSASKVNELLKNLQRISAEKGVAIQDAKSFNVWLDFTQSEGSLSFNMNEVYLSIKKFALNFLFLYEAAEKSALPTISSFFLESWKKTIELKIQRKIRDNKEISTASNEERRHELINNKISKISSKIVWPAFHNLPAVCGKLLARLSTPLAKELVVMHLREYCPQEPIPSHIAAMMKYSSPDAEECYLIKKYGKNNATISFPSNSKSLLTNEQVHTSLQNHPNAQILDLSNCTRINEYCLNKRMGSTRQLIAERA